MPTCKADAGEPRSIPPPTPPPTNRKKKRPISPEGGPRGSQEGVVYMFYKLLDSGSKVASGRPKMPTKSADMFSYGVYWCAFVRARVRARVRAYVGPRNCPICFPG